MCLINPDQLFDKVYWIRRFVSSKLGTGRKTLWREVSEYLNISVNRIFLFPLRENYWICLLFSWNMTNCRMCILIYELTMSGHLTKILWIRAQFKPYSTADWTSFHMQRVLWQSESQHKSILEKYALVVQ